MYRAQGAALVSRPDLFKASDIVLQVRATPTDGSSLRSGQTVIGFADPLGAPDAIRKLAPSGINLFSMELMPRITRAQSMDALSSMATIAGYKAVLLAATTLPRMFPMLMTAAGTISPARVFIMGAGVAGLQAISTARRLGAKVEAYDVRPAVKEQVQSLGAKFVELPLESGDAEDKGGYAKAQDETFYKRQREMMLKVVAASEVVITTALIPGKPAPKLLIADAVKNMKPGSVIVDLAGEAGGNCELTRPGETIVEHDVTIAAPLNLPSEMPDHSSALYARNIMSLLELMTGDEGALELNWDDEIIKGAAITRDGEIVHEGARNAADRAPAGS
jgi:NAD(P) transhydrogenase subunit alpha